MIQAGNNTKNMKQNVLIFIAVFIGGFLVSCKDEFTFRQQDYPIVVVDSCSVDHYFSANFYATNYNPGNRPCTEYGVIYTLSNQVLYPPPNYTPPIPVEKHDSILGDLPKGKFVFRVENLLSSNSQYNVRFYAKSDYTVLSDLFVLRTPPYPDPIITGCDKDTVTIGSELTIFGKNFKPANSPNKVYFYSLTYGGSVTYAQVKTVTDTTLTVFIPALNYTNTILYGVVCGDKKYISLPKHPYLASN